MKAIIQRVTSASVTVDGEIISSIGKGLCVLVGIHRADTRKELEYIAKKILSTRIFDDPNTGKRWDKSVKDANLEVLCVSQFTLYHILKVSKLPKILLVSYYKYPFYYKWPFQKMRKVPIISTLWSR